MFSGELVGGDAVDFFGGERWRELFDEAEESGAELLELLQLESDRFKRDRTDFAERVAIGVVGIGGEAEADHAFVSFLRCSVELRQAREIADDEREHAGGQRIERAEMTDATLAKNAAHAGDHVVRGPTRGLIDDDNAIHERIEYVGN